MAMSIPKGYTLGITFKVAFGVIPSLRGIVLLLLVK